MPKPKAELQSLLTSLQKVTEGHNVFHLQDLTRRAFLLLRSGHPVLLSLLQKLLLRPLHPKLTAGPLLKADTLIHSFLSIFRTYLPPQTQTSTSWSSGLS